MVVQNCPQCDAEVRPGSRFCQSCGHPLSGAGGRRALPWVIAGATVAVLSAVLLVRLTSEKVPAAAAGVPPELGTAMPAPDISNLSPRERADRLFNRVMSAAERGDSGEMQFFVPMALQSYALVGPVDPDARYHVGMIDVVNHDYRAALAQADSIARAVPTHLFANLLRIQVATSRGDAAARMQAYRAFTAAYSSESAAQRPEYEEHRVVLEHTRDEARKALGSKP
jgi:hypothetical protein